MESSFSVGNVCIGFMLNMLAPPGKVDDTFGNSKVRLDSESIFEELEIWSFVDEHD